MCYTIDTYDRWSYDECVIGIYLLYASLALCHVHEPGDMNENNVSIPVWDDIVPFNLTSRRFRFVSLFSSQRVLTVSARLSH